MNTKAFFLCWEGSNLILGTGKKKPNIYSKNSSCYQVFSSNSQKLTFWCEKKIITHPDGFV